MFTQNSLRRLQIPEGFSVYFVFLFIREKLCLTHGNFISKLHMNWKKDMRIQTIEMYHLAHLWATVLKKITHTSSILTNTWDWFCKWISKCLSKRLKRTDSSSSSSFNLVIHSALLDYIVVSLWFLLGVFCHESFNKSVDVSFLHYYITSNWIINSQIATQYIKSNLQEETFATVCI